jgi:predicted ATPase
MTISDEMRRLEKKWTRGGGPGWPKRLEWIQVKGIRGWAGQRINFQFPIVAIVGENGSGKSTLLQSAACVYRPETSDTDARTYFPSEFFPDTAWDQVRDASIEYAYTQGPDHESGSIRKPTTRWLGNIDRPVRKVEYIDLNRIQPLGARVGYARIAKVRHQQQSAISFDDQQVKRLSHVMGREYDSARIAISTIDAEREIPVISRQQREYSGFHQGSGETTVTELLQADFPKTGLVLIDEIESSLHPRSQRRLIRDLAEQCRERELQIILTTHSPYVLEELPLEARMYILEASGGLKTVISGVSPQFAMTKMDDEAYPECDLYVEDNAAKVMLGEILAYHGRDLLARCAIVPFGAASVGHALGQMIINNRFRRPSLVFLDGDTAAAVGCILLPGGDAPERVIFKTLKRAKWGQLWTRIARDISLVEDACTNAMTLPDHHDWVRQGANQLKCGGDTLWQAMCAEWTQTMPLADAKELVQAVDDVLD